MTGSLAVPIRWSDLDSYGHVNNATLLRLVQHAGAARCRPGRAHAPYEMVVQYLRPIRHVDRHVEVTSSPDGATTEVHVRHAGSGTPTLCARVGWGPITLTPQDASPPTHSVVVRPCDFGADGSITAAGVLELVQESRFALIRDLLDNREVAGMAVVEVRAAVAQDLRWRPTPWPASAWVERVGASSLHVRSANDMGVLGATVLVAIDEDTGRRRPWSEPERERLLRLSLQATGAER